MRILLLLGVVVLFISAFADHDDSHQKHDSDDHDDDDHAQCDHKDDHDDDDDHDHKKSLVCHKLAPHNTQFYFDFYQQVALSQPSGNIAISPVSISVALAFLSLGAEAQTQSQIIEGLGFNTSEISVQKIHEGFHHRLNLLNDASKKLQLSGGNALFISKKHKILQTFTTEARRLYHSDVFSSDFEDNEEAKNQINSYVGRKTNGKIAEMLDSVDQDAIFYLINYIHLRGNWENPFDEKLTSEGDFHVNEKTTVKVPFMTRTGTYRVAIEDEATVVSIPYKGNVSALLIMPKEGTLHEMELKLNKELSMEWRKKMSMQVVELSLPKFSISGTINLKETLRKMGVVDVFSDNADLSGITGKDNVKISKAIHKAALSVDEKGTEAAGSTGFEAVPTLLPPSITFNRPFLLSMHEHNTRSLLFAARITNPQK